MLEWLVAIGTTEVGKAVLEQGLKLSQAAAEDYVKDFFKDCLKGTFSLGNPSVTKKAVGEALKAFLEITIEELEDQDLSKAEIRNGCYELALVEFVKDAAVKPLLGRAFEPDCKAVDGVALAGIWGRSNLRGKPFPVMPNGFDWAEVGRLYLKKVRKIVRDTPELRSLLEIALQWKKVLNKNSIKPIQQFAYTTGKKATDSTMIIDAMDLLYSRKFDGFCLVTSDSDFTGLAVRIREEGLQVFGFGEQKTPEAFCNACHRFVFTEVLRQSVELSSNSVLPSVSNISPESKQISSQTPTPLAEQAFPKEFLMQALEKS